MSQITLWSVYETTTGFFESSATPNYVCKLDNVLYGLKQAPRAWYSRLSSKLHSLGFLPSKADTSLFLFDKFGITMFLPIYVDDIIVTSFFRCCNYSSSSQPEFRFCSQGSWRSLHYFLGIEVHKLPNGLLLNQDKYVTDLLARVGMHDCTSCPTPLSLNDNLSLTDGTPLGSEDSTCYRSIVGALQYLTLTRSDLAFSVNKVC
jgi:hypothetical protein